jgi:hypothetical protein
VTTARPWFGSSAAASAIPSGAHREPRRKEL